MEDRVLKGKDFEMAKTALISMMGTIQASNHTNNFDLMTNGEYIWVKSYENEDGNLESGYFWIHDHLLGKLSEKELNNIYQPEQN